LTTELPPAGPDSADGLPTGDGCGKEGRKQIRVVIADDQALIRAGLRALLELQDDIAVVGEAETGDEAIQLAGQTTPDVVLMDIRMPGLDGIEATRRLAGDATAPGPRIIVLTTFELDEYVADAVLAGASGFMGKNADPDALAAAVRTVAGGGSLLSSTATRQLMGRFRDAPPPPSGGSAALDALTPREREVVMLLAAGESADDIAARLYLSPLTVKTHIGRAINKTGARDRTHLVVLALTSPPSDQRPTGAPDPPSLGTP
jgi:DNA-binding NarL/FixJ family response regulator